MLGLDRLDFALGGLAIGATDVEPKERPRQGGKIASKVNIPRAGVNYRF